MFLGVAVPAGEHEIRLLYETPGQKGRNGAFHLGLLLLAGITCLPESKKETDASKEAEEIKAVWGDHEKNETAG